MFKLLTTATTTAATTVITSQLVKNQIVLTLLRKLELKILNFPLILIVPMIIESVYDTLRIGVACVDYLTSLALCSICHIRETSLYTSVNSVDTSHNGIRLLAVLELVLITHF